MVKPSEHQVSTRVDGDTFHAFSALASILGQTQADTLQQAIDAFVATLPAATRRAIEAATRAGKDHCAVCKKKTRN